MIEPKEARKRVLEAVKPIGTETVRTSNAGNRILGEDLVSRISSPPFDKAAMDGYAVMKEDLKELPVQLEVVGEVFTGQFPNFSIREGQCAKIATGAPLPEGANDVVMIEHTKKIGEKKVEILKPPGGNVCVEGEDLKEGEIVLKRGRRLTPLRLAVAASSGHAELVVFKRPTIALLCTGTEIREPGEGVKKGQIYNAIGPMLSPTLEHYASQFNYLGIVGDDEKKLHDKIQAGLKNDLLIISGGVSVGERDLVPGVLRDLRVEEVFHKWAIKPGKPTFFGVKDGTAVFGMPGNPQSCFVVFNVLVLPALAKMGGASELPPTYEVGRMAESFVDRSDRDHYLPCKIETKDGINTIKRAPFHGSADIKSPSSADGFFLVPADVVKIEKGKPMKFFKI